MKSRTIAGGWLVICAALLSACAAETETPTAEAAVPLGASGAPQTEGPEPAPPEPPKSELGAAPECEAEISNCTEAWSELHLWGLPPQSYIRMRATFSLVWVVGGAGVQQENAEDDTYDTIWTLKNASTTETIFVLTDFNLGRVWPEPESWNDWWIGDLSFLPTTATIWPQPDLTLVELTPPNN